MVELVARSVRSLVVLAMQASADYLRNQNPWASEIRTPEILATFVPYGANAQSVVPHLRETAALFEKGEIDLPKKLSKQKAEAVRRAIANIEAAQDRPDLQRLN